MRFDSTHHKAIERLLARAGDLPAMPGMVAEVMRLTENPDASLSDLSRAIEKDPAMAAKVLKVSNSPYFGMRQYVGSLKLALVVLGVREVRNIVVALTVFDALSSEPAAMALARRLWPHSFLTGSLCKRLGQRLGLGMQGEDFIAGLLHDIGKFVMVTKLGADYGNIVSHCAPEELPEQELARYGFNHGHIGAALAERWNLPETLVGALWLHHPDPEASLTEAKAPVLAALVRLANSAAHEKPRGFDGENKGAFQCCRDAEPWEALSEVPNAVADGKRYDTWVQIFADIGPEAPPPL